MLPLAFGLASYPGSTGRGTGAFMLLMFCFLGWYSLASMARAKHLTSHDDTDSLRSVHEGMGFQFGTVATLSSLFLTAGCCLFYSAFLGDIFTPLLRVAAPNVRIGRSGVLLALALVPLLPLVLLEDLSSLQVRLSMNMLWYWASHLLNKTRSIYFV